MADLLDEHRIDFWLTRDSECNADLLAKYRDLLSDEERYASTRFRFERDRRRYVVSRALIRTVLSRYAGTPPDAWRFKTGAYGRPEISNQGDIERALSFNLSHSADLIVLGVTRDEPLGVDVEVIRDTVSMSIAERFFARTEVFRLAAVSAKLRAERFFELWTLKEAYMKARRLGLSITLDSFSFDLSDDVGIRFVDRANGAQGNEEWRFWQLCPVNGFIAAVCVRHRAGQKLYMRKLVPLSAESVVRCSLLRQSHCTEYV